ncbi:hypothetical protein SEPMUDRAFT_78740 [Lecanosticta acicola]|uniref:C2H2-type domain-containing protein n=1 Tax=Lecanosticta acicola TaxID=111012 RepID=A0AAI8Z951_9PEZI|nr:hypothetical protein SEPMUDRAFT_78740 [Lecanosticta acicola]
MVDVQSRVIVPREAVSQYVSGLQFQHQQQQAVARFRANDRSGLGVPGSRQEPCGQGRMPRLFAGNRAQPSTVIRHTSRQAAGARQSVATPDTNNTYGSEAVPSYDTATATATATATSCTATSGRIADSATSTGWLPQESSSPALGSYFHPSHTTWPANVSAPGLLYDPSPSPHTSRNPPSIRVITAWDGSGDQDFPQPQDAPFSASSASPLPHDYAPYNSDFYDSGHLGPLPYQMPQESENMQTPVSPVSATANSPQDQSMGEPQLQQFPTRKRSHSVMSQADAAALMDNTHHSRSGSVASVTAGSPNDPTDDYPRGSRAFKRGEPPQNSENKFICTFSDECQGQTFDRKCEWSKHMDKHDRPYRCPHPSCAKLQGFTYSGGLLRHEREVHGKHGGPKTQMMCPHPECKRHTGKGFTRKENLNEHLRRVHASKEDESQQSLLGQSTTDITLGAPDGETHASHISEAVDHELAPTSGPPTKRKRSLPPSVEDGLGEDPADMAQREIKHLRELLAQKDQTINNLHADVMALEAQTQQLQAQLLQAQHQQPATQG